jgi:hypothetical protein
VKLLEVLHAPHRRPPQPDLLRSDHVDQEVQVSKGDERGMIIRRKMIVSTTDATGGVDVLPRTEAGQKKCNRIFRVNPNENAPSRRSERNSRSGLYLQGPKAENASIKKNSSRYQDRLRKLTVSITTWSLLRQMYKE